MRIVGIIAEYNPFHNGHAYQIKKIKEELQADFVVIAMSGDFVQRGTPSVIDKYARTKMALNCGADLVIELPVLWATASAEYFAVAGITLFDKMGCIDGVCFGAETDNLTLLSQIAEIFILEPETYRMSLSSHLKEGLAFPTARSKALRQYLSEITTNSSLFSSLDETLTTDFSCEIFNILNTPNNILAIEYLKALKRRNSSIIPHIIKREGAGYHEKNFLNLSASTKTNTPFENMDNAPIASATAIRKILNESLPTDFRFLDKLTTAMPMETIEVLKEYLSKNCLVQSNDFSSILGYKLLSSNVNILADIGDSNKELANRIFKNRMCFSNFEQFCDQNKSKNITYTRLSRIFLHFILNISNEDYSFGKEIDYIPYLRILGFRKDASALLKILKNSSMIPIISKLADADSILDQNARIILEKDIFSANLYSQIRASKNGSYPKNEYKCNIVRI